MTTNEQERDIMQRIEVLLTKYGMNFGQDMKTFANLVASLDIDPIKGEALQKFFCSELC